VPPAAQATPGKQRSPVQILAVGLAVIAILVFVGLISQRSESPSTPTPDAGVDSMTGALYFTSTFDPDDPNNRYWPQGEEGDAFREITADGGYLFRNERLDRALTTIFEPSYTFENVSITMTVTLREDSSTTSGYGIVFRYMDDNNFNVFAIDGSGRYSIWVREDGQWRELRGASEDWTPDDVINPIGSPNTLSIDVVGDHLTGYVNGHEVTAVLDDTIVSGAVGIYLASTPGGTASMIADTFAALEPSPVIESMTGDE
jgi:hypothetical protein